MPTSVEPLADNLPPNLVQLRDALSGVDIAELEVCTWLDRRVLRAQVLIHIGKYAGSIQRVGWSFPDDSQPYPEYAPHWFHVEGNYNDGKGGGCEEDHDEDGQLWLAWSRPIGTSWIGPYRTSQKLLRATVARFWKAAK